MKMSGQSRSFVKQVQVDLLALSDDDLYYTIRQWIDGSDSSGILLDVPEDTRFALGYTPILEETHPLSDGHSDISGTENEGAAHWQPPSPLQLRTLLTTMDSSLFARHVITFAFKFLHTTYPEWYDGVTFNAHLANYLRQMRAETANPGQKARQSHNSKSHQMG